jgi:hypothetical protein
MKTVKKYTTFEELKSSEKKRMDYPTSIKKHNELKKIINSIYSEKVNKNAFLKSK